MADYRIQIIPVLKKGEVQKQLDEVGKGSNLGKKLGASLSQQFATELRHKIDYSIISGSYKAIKDMIANVKELNSAQTELRKVSELAGDSLARYTDEAYKAGEGVARTGTEMVEAATLKKVECMATYMKNGVNCWELLKLYLPKCNNDIDIWTISSRAVIDLTEGSTTRIEIISVGGKRPRSAPHPKWMKI